MVRRSTWVLLGVFIVLAGFTWYFQKNQTEKTSDATATATTARVYVYQLDSSEVSEVQIADASGNKIELYKDQTTSQWAVKDVPIEQADSFQIESVLGQLFSLQSMDTLTQSLPLDSTGLATPAYTITMKMIDGSETITSIGAQTAIGSGYYLRIGDGTINIVDKVSLDQVLNLLSNPPLVATETPEAGLPTEIEPTATPTQ